MKHSILVPLLAGALLAATGARADPRLDEVVYSPYVQNGTAEVEIRTARQIGGAQEGALTTVVEAEYGLNDRLSLSLVGAAQREPGGGTRFTSIGLEAIAYLGQIPGVGVDAGAYLEYGQGLAGEANSIEGKLLLAKTAGRFQGLANLIIERPFGPRGEDYASYGYAASATWRTVGALRLGAEAFGDLGSDHGFPGPAGAYVGPQLLWEGRPPGSPVEIGIDAGWLIPVGADRREAQSQARLMIEFERRF